MLETLASSKGHTVSALVRACEASEALRCSVPAALGQRIVRLLRQLHDELGGLGKDGSRLIRRLPVFAIAT